MFKSFFLNHSLKTRIVFLYSLFAVALVGAMTLYAYHFTVSLMKEKETEILRDSAQALETRISMRFQYITEEYLSIFDDETFLQLYLTGIETRDTMTASELNSAYREFFSAIQFRHADLVKRIFMADSAGNIFSNEYTLPYEKYWEFMHSPYFETSMEHKNQLMYCDLEPESDCFSVLRSFYFVAQEDSVYPGVGYTSQSDRDYSVLVFALKKKYLGNLIKAEAEKRQTNILILDQNNNVVVRAGDDEWLPGKNTQTLIDQLETMEASSFETKLDGRDVGVHARSIDLLGWKLVYVYNMSIIYRMVGRIRSIAILIFVLADIVVFWIASIVSKTVVAPIQLLEKSMEDAVENDLKTEFYPKYNDEIARLGRQFQNLLERISQLMVDIRRVEEQKRIEEFKALQAQINPHFLYNTLDMVYWMAKLEGNEQIADTIMDLTDFFRLSLNKGQDITTVSLETKRIRKYLEIQKMRFDEKFDYTIELEPGVEELRIPKLILQPFVENSIAHGFENIPYIGHITVLARKEGDDLVFQVMDNGCGMPREKIAALNAGENISRQESHGYAVGNVRSRIHLYYGADYGPWFDETCTEGTCVTIRFPAELKGGDFYAEDDGR